MAPKKQRAAARVKIPLTWLLSSWLCMIGLGLLIFLGILKKTGATLPLVAGQSTDPFFFAGVAALVIPLLLLVYITKILQGIAQRRTALEIAKDVGKDLAVAVAATALDALSSGGGGTDNRSSSGGGNQGGGGSFGGGGASGSF
ncbi:MAG: hypothetical protein BWK76_03075 [Desulfobulbaceae bacterium A2]|nr:MAG: hypothetical protein BWK76_03075 [Desulfobulbaceae bacterium A2]